MNVDLDDLDFSSDGLLEISGFLNWAKEDKIWNGRFVSWMKQSDFCDGMQKSLDQHLQRSNEEAFGSTIEDKCSDYSNILAPRISPTLNKTLSITPFFNLKLSKHHWRPTLYHRISSHPNFQLSPEKSIPTTACLSPRPSWIVDFLQTIGRGMIDPDLFDPNIPLPHAAKSSFFTTDGIRDPHLRIGGINGMNTTFDEAFSHANYLAQLASNRSIDWVHNCSHGSILDAAEIFTLNYAGISPNTSQLLRENWESFHRENVNRPTAKYFQICHSQGAIHVRNALMNAPKEIQDRVIVLAIAPAAIITDDLCFRADNVVCKGDMVPYGELIHAGLFDSNDMPNSSKLMEFAMEQHKNLNFVNPLFDTKNVHDFQNPAFVELIIKHISEYIARNGEYRCE